MFELVPNERIRYTDKFEAPNLPGPLEVTVALRPDETTCQQCASLP